MDIELTHEEQRALGVTLKFRIDLLKRIEHEGAYASREAKAARVHIDALVSAAEKLELP